MPDGYTVVRLAGDDRLIGLGRAGDGVPTLDVGDEGLRARALTGGVVGVVSCQCA